VLGLRTHRAPAPPLPQSYWRQLWRMVLWQLGVWLFGLLVVSMVLTSGSTTPVNNLQDYFTVSQTPAGA
jgi:energy-coupling factor transporter transmembrane protein EcfT